jgi:hypothetical protein
MRTMSNIVNDPNIVNSSNVVNCPYKWAECSKLSNCCDKEKNKNKQKNIRNDFMRMLWK